MMSSTAIVLDTNIWLNGIRATDNASIAILNNLGDFEVVLPGQVRREIARNLSNSELDLIYGFINDAEGTIDFAHPPVTLSTKYYDRGLRKGDMIIAAYCEWRHIDVIVSTNRDFLRGISGELPFDIMSPQVFCQTFDLFDRT